MPRGSITDQDVDFVETWENIAARQNAIVRLSPRGDEAPQVINGPGNFFITTEERIITEGKVRLDKDNPFKNGDFRPVIVPDSVTIESNPNALSDAEIVRILKSSDVAWDEWLSTLDSVATLRRMMDVGELQDDLTMKRFRQIEARLVEVRGTSRVRLTSQDERLNSFLSDRPNSGGGGSDTTSNGAGNPRRQGGRSSDYR